MYKNLLADMVGSILSDRDFYPYCSDSGDFVKIVTRFSTDPRYANNGGDYFFFRKYELVPGGVAAWRDWSCDIQPLEYNDKQLYTVAVKDLTRIADFAVTIAKAELEGQALPACPQCGREK